jgi:exopolysaccharide production protein ExoZ
LSFFLVSASLLPTKGFPFYDIGWTLQHEMAFYLMAAIVVPLAGIAGLIGVLLASYVAFQFIDMPWYLAALASHHGEFLAGALAFLTRKRLERFGFLLPTIVGGALVAWFAAFEKTQLLPFGLFFLIIAFANLQQKPLSKPLAALRVLGDASYSIYLIHPMVFLAASAAVSKAPWLPIWSEEPIRWVSILLIMLVSILSWKYFEKPVIALGNAMAESRPRRALPIEP